jgi:hypothetical protein
MMDELKSNLKEFFGWSDMKIDEYLAQFNSEIKFGYVPSGIPAWDDRISYDTGEALQVGRLAYLDSVYSDRHYFWRVAFIGPSPYLEGYPAPISLVEAFGLKI